MRRRSWVLGYAIIWEFVVPPAKMAAFEAAYGTDGAWTHLFRQAFGFIEVKLLRCEDQAGRYLTIDRWASVTAFEDFKRLYAAEYQALDAQLEGLASTEVRVGAFEEWPFTQ
jgi:heme-degrading monooxygenase HmoA